ncbi:MAG: hypothetical protein NVS3B10_20320 [Polyangiales bacterium]
MHVRAVFPILALATVACPALASADDLAPFERPGRVVVGVGATASRTHLSYKSPEGAATGATDATSLGAGARVEAFVGSHLTVGGGLDLGWAYVGGVGGGGGHLLSVSPTLRVGVYVPLSDRVGFWPYAFGGVTHMEPLEPTDTWFAGASARFVLRFDEHWFLVAEPLQATYARATTEGGSAVAGPLGGLGLRSGIGLGLAL